MYDTYELKSNGALGILVTATEQSNITGTTNCAQFQIHVTQGNLR